MNINEVIQESRIFLGLSKMAFTEKLHFNFPTVNRWEKGRVVSNPIATVTNIPCIKVQYK